MRMFPRSDNIGRLSPAVLLLLLLLGALSLVVAVSSQLGEEQEDADSDSEPAESEESAEWSSTESELILAGAPTGLVDTGTLLEIYKEFHRPRRGGDNYGGDDNEDDGDGDGDGESRFSLSGIVGRIQEKMSRGRNFPRSIIYDCPTKPSPRDPYRRARMLYYNPATDRTTRIEESRSGSWLGADIESFKRAGFDLNKTTLAIMGGYLQTGLSEWIQLSKRRVLELSRNKSGREVPFNLLIFDWAAYGLDFYEKSVSFVPHMASVLANFFEILIDTHGYKLSQVQFTSFSLSTHITGNAGRQLKAKYGEPVPLITALDPTGVCFHDNVHGNTKWAQEYGLRPTDAKLVIARHYNMKQLGAGRFIGGVDIVVNNGMAQPVMYPERMQVRSLLQGVGWFIASHMRGVEHESEPPVPDHNSECHEIAYQCSSYEAFDAGECGHCRANNQSCFHIGTMANLMMGQRPIEMDLKPGLEMYMTTGVRRYCEHTFQVVARLEEPSAETVSDFRLGKFKVKVGELVINPTHHVAGDKKELFTQLVRPKRLPAPFPESVPVDESVRPLLKSIKYVALTHMSHISREVRLSHSIKYCLDSSSEETLVKCK